MCNKKYARLSSHLKYKHNIQGNTIEPKNVMQYVKYLNLFTSPNAKILYKYKKVINDCLYSNKSIPSRIYAIIEKRMKEYQQNKGMKLVAKVATDMIHKRKCNKKKQCTIQKEVPKAATITSTSKPIKENVSVIKHKRKCIKKSNRVISKKERPATTANQFLKQKHIATNKIQRKEYPNNVSDMDNKIVKIKAKKQIKSTDSVNGK